MDTSIQFRRRYSDNYRRQVVAETWHGGESVSEVARRHDLNTNLLFKWRQRYPALATPADAALSGLIPIHLKPTPIGADEASPADGPSGQIAITLRGGHRLTLEGAVDPALARVVLESLR